MCNISNIYIMLIIIWISSNIEELKLYNMYNLHLQQFTDFYTDLLSSQDYYNNLCVYLYVR